MKALSEASFVLGLEIHRDRSRDLLSLSQKVLLKRFSMDDCSPGDTLIIKERDFFNPNNC